MEAPPPPGAPNGARMVQAMAKKKAPNKSEQTAIALFQELTKKLGTAFPRPPEMWATPGPLPPVRGLLMSDEDYSTAMDKYSAAIEREQRFNPEKYFVMAYLSGTVVEDEKGRHEQVYFGPFTELLGRWILAELLKSSTPIPSEIRQALAALVSPIRIDTQHSEREFSIRFRMKGNRKNLIRDIQVSEEIAKALDAGQMTKQALGEAAEKFEISDSEAERIWQNYRDAFYRLGWLKKAPRPNPKLKRH